MCEYLYSLWVVTIKEVILYSLEPHTPNSDQSMLRVGWKVKGWKLVMCKYLDSLWVVTIKEVILYSLEPHTPNSDQSMLRVGWKVKGWKVHTMTLYLLFKTFLTNRNQALQNR